MATGNKVRFGIFQKILFTTLAVSLIPLGGIWYLDHRTTLELTGQSIDQKLSSFTSNLGAQVDNWVDMNERMLLQNASLNDIMTSDAGVQNPVLHSIIRQYPWTYLAFTADLQGNNIGRSDDGPLKYYGDRDYFTQVVQGAQFGNQVLIGKTSGKPALVLSTGIFDRRAKLEGVIAIAMNLTDLSDAIAAAKIGKSGFAFLVDEKGEIIAHPNSTYTKSRADFSSNPAFLASSRDGARRAIFTDTNGNRVVASMLKTRHGWTLVAQQDYKEAYAPVQATNQRALLLLLVTLAIVAVCAFLLSRKLAEPIRSLTRATDQLSQGKLDAVITGLRRRDEIGELAQAIDRLGMSIKVAIKRLNKA